MVPKWPWGIDRNKDGNRFYSFIIVYCDFLLLQKYNFNSSKVEHREVFFGKFNILRGGEGPNGGLTPSECCSRTRCVRLQAACRRR